MSILTWLLFGLIVGAIAKFLMPGNDGSSWIATIILGIAGSFVGGYLANLIFGYGATDTTHAAGWVGSILGAMILLGIYRATMGRRSAIR